MFTKRSSRQFRSVIGHSIDSSISPSISSSIGSSTGSSIVSSRLVLLVLQCCLLVAAVCLSTVPASAIAADKAESVDKLTAIDRQAIEATIRQQLDAFGRDDAERAFAFATPDIQRMFGSSDSFMRMVRENYEPVYRSSGIQFERLTPSASSATLPAGVQWIQTVRLTDDEGKVWRALFTMRRQADRGWKVGGCQLVETSALST